MPPIGTANQLANIGSAIGLSHGGAPSSPFGYVQSAPAAPAPAPAVTSTGGGGGGSGTSAYTASNNAYWQSIIDQATQAMGRAPVQAQIGHQNVSDAYNAALNTLTNQEGQANRDYTTSRNQTQQDNVTAKSQIDQGVTQQSTALKRLFGASGAGDSSAAYILGPYAAGLQGNQQRQQVQTAYGRNIGALDTNWQDTEQQFGNSKGSLAADRTNKDRAIDSGIDNTLSQLLQEKAQAQHYMNQAPDPGILTQLGTLGNQIDQLGATQTFTPQVVNYAAPNLAQYTYSSAAAPTVSPNVAPTAAGNLGAYATLLGQQKDKNGNPIGAIS